MTDIPLKRKYRNPTPGHVGAVQVDPEGKTPKGVNVPPGGEIFLSEYEERLTAEAPAKPEDNPFIKEWDEPVAWDEYRNVTATEKRTGMLVPVGDKARPIGSDRWTPSAAAAGVTTDEPEEPEAPEEPQPDPRETTGAPTQPHTEPPEEPQPDERETVGTPEAPERQDEHVAAQRAKEEPVPVGAGTGGNERPATTGAIGVPPTQGIRVD